jgi:hypothetical protein
MEGLALLMIVYWLAVVVIFVVGLIKLIIAASNGTPARAGLKLLIISIIMVVIGAGACAFMLTGIDTR